jgi:dTDP-4-dehydrorhamnose 3,5-epimerase
MPGGRILERTPPESIEGVSICPCRIWRDARGDFTEVFRRDEFSSSFGDAVQVNCTRSAQGVIRGLHFHRFQTDVWFPVSGLMRAVLVDLRPDSRSYRKCSVFDIGADDAHRVLIPPGIAHGYSVLADACLFYVVSSYYDGSDEYGVAWDDPEIAADWGVRTPVLSVRDTSNPVLGDISERRLRKLLGG